MATAREVSNQLIEKVVETQLQYRKDYPRYYSPEQVTPEAVKEDYSYLDSAMNEIEELFYPNETLSIPAGEISIDDNHGGGEGDGETRFIIFKLNNNDGDEQLFRVDGYYASWDGSNWDSAELYEVEKVPVQAFKYMRKR